MGYVGFFDIDTVVDDHDQLYMLELNARRTGGTFVHEFACRCLGPDYLERVVILSKNVIESDGISDVKGLLERLSDLLYPDYSPGSGVVLTITSTLINGEFGCILVASSEGQLWELDQALQARMHARPGRGAEARG
jgi:hypothetical protein